MNCFDLTAIDGSNPLGFLAAIGALRLSSLKWPELEPKLSWRRKGRWIPQLVDVPSKTQEQLCDDLMSAPWAPVDAFEPLGKNLTVEPNTLAEFIKSANASVKPEDRRLSDFAAAFGSEACLDEKLGRIQYSSLCFITGSGHQDFLGTAANLARVVTSAHLHEAMFGVWRDAQKGNSFRWNPTDARSYALRYSDPGPEGAWTTWGANRLAFEALPFFPTIPVSGKLRTTGFTRGGRNRWPEFVWPIWDAPIAADEVRSLVGLKALVEDDCDEDLSAYGIAAVFRATRVRIGQGANFKVSFRAARGG